MSSVMLRVAELLYAPKNYARRKSSCFNMSWAGGVCEIIRVHLGVILYIFIPKPAASCLCVTTWIWWGSLPWLATAWCIQLLIASHLWLLFIPKYSITQVGSIKHLFKIIKPTRESSKAFWQHKLFVIHITVEKCEGFKFSILDLQKIATFLFQDLVLSQSNFDIPWKWHILVMMIIVILSTSN